jgi:phosphotriesterase-related protein
MSQVNTVTGAVDSSALGITLIHEHLLIGHAGWEWDSRYHFDRADAMARCVDRLQELKAFGVKTIVDPCPMDLGRDPVFQQEASVKSGIQVIAATGFYHHEVGYLSYFHDKSEEVITEIFTDEIMKGMAHTDIKAGIIKCANAGIVNDHDEKVLRAAGNAGKATSTPIITHNTPHQPVGMQQLAAFDAAGFDLGKAAIGHACGSGDMRYYFDVLSKGAFLAFDQLGLELAAPDELRIASLVGLVHSGHAGRLLLGHDSVACLMGRGWDFPPEVLALLKNWHPTHLFKNIIPILLNSGVSQAQIDTMLVENPRRLFGGASNH